MRGSGSHLQEVGAGRRKPVGRWRYTFVFEGDINRQDQLGEFVFGATGGQGHHGSEGLKHKTVYVVCLVLVYG